MHPDQLRDGQLVETTKPAHRSTHGGRRWARVTVRLLDPTGKQEFKALVGLEFGPPLPGSPAVIALVARHPKGYLIDKTGALILVRKPGDVSLNVKGWIRAFERDVSEADLNIIRESLAEIEPVLEALNSSRPAQN